ncbi:hypothetical protein BU15DRAFT_46957 [Melanogaster broomeanus]|nr:hypothetical protein BU15DRAFT_46957 [Melanogaster broomeanus]
MAIFSVASLYQWPRHCTPKAREIVLNIIKSAQEPLSTKDIYNLAVGRMGIETATESPRSVLKSIGTSQPTDGTPPPYPTKEIRSIRYLKTVVLRDLATRNQIEKVMVQKTLDAEEVERRVESAPRVEQNAIYKKLSKPFNTWVWRPLQEALAPTTKSTKAIGHAPPGVRELSPAAVGVGEDWSHLNKRRQRARKMKVERDLKRMMDLQAAQRKAALVVKKAREAQHCAVGCNSAPEEGLPAPLSP